MHVETSIKKTCGEKRRPGRSVDRGPGVVFLAELLEQRELGGPFGPPGWGGQRSSRRRSRRKVANKAEPELMLSETITCLLQGEAAGVRAASSFRKELARACAEIGVDAPAISDDALAELRSLRDDYALRWQRAGSGETIDVALF